MINGKSKNLFLTRNFKYEFEYEPRFDSLILLINIFTASFNQTTSELIFFVSKNI